MSGYFDQLALAGLFSAANVSKPKAIDAGAIADDAVITGAILKEWVNQHAAALDPLVLVKPNRAAFALLLEIRFINGMIGDNRPLATSVPAGYCYMDTANEDIISWSDNVTWRDVGSADRLIDIALIALRNRVEAKVGAEVIDALKGGATSTADTLGKIETLLTALQAAVAGKLTTADLQAALDGKAITISQVTGLTGQLANKLDTAARGVAEGVASLDGSGKVPSAQLPSYVDDVVEAATFSALPGTGETSKIYVTLDTNRQYRWAGSGYVELVSSPGTTDAVPEGSVNRYHTDARAVAAVKAAVAGVSGQYAGFDESGNLTARPLRSTESGNLLRTVASGALELLASDLPGSGGGIRSYANRAAATAELPGNLNTGNIIVVGGGNGGFFEIAIGDFSSELAADPAQGLIFPIGLSDGSQAVARRIWEQEQGISSDWFDVVPGTVNVTKWNQMIARLPGLQTRTIRLRAGTYVFPSKPTFPEVVDLWGAGLSLTYIERGYSESGGNEVGFFDFTAELSRNSRLNHLTLRPASGTTGGCMVKMATPVDVINSWCRWEHVLITQFTGAYAVGVVVDGRDNDVSGGQGHRDWVTDNCFIFPGSTGDAIRFYNATNGHHSGLWAGGNVIIDGGGTALQNTQDFALSGLRCLGTVVLRNCDRVFVSGVVNRVEIEATATRSLVKVTDRAGGVSNLAPASCQVITQNGSYGNFIYEGTHDFKSPPIFRDGFTIEKAASPHPTVPVNYRGDAVQGGSIAGFQFNARDNKSPTPDFLTYAVFRAVSRDITDGTEDGGFALDLRVNGSLITTWNFDNGIWYQTATGGNCGAGTMNCLDLYRNGVKVVGARETGFTAMTGTAQKGALATYDAGTASGTYTSSELQAVMNALQGTSRRLKAIEDALFAHGLIGA